MKKPLSVKGLTLVFLCLSSLLFTSSLIQTAHGESQYPSAYTDMVGLVPYYIQKGETCGPTSVLQVLQWFGRLDLDIDDVFSAIGHGPGITYLNEINYAFAQLMPEGTITNFGGSDDAESAKNAVKSVLLWGSPVICCVQVPWATEWYSWDFCNHYLTIVGYNDTAYCDDGMGIGGWYIHDTAGYSNGAPRCDFLVSYKMFDGWWNHWWDAQIWGGNNARGAVYAILPDRAGGGEDYATGLPELTIKGDEESLRLKTGKVSEGASSLDLTLTLTNVGSDISMPQISESQGRDGVTIEIVDIRGTDVNARIDWLDTGEFSGFRSLDTGESGGPHSGSIQPTRKLELYCNVPLSPDIPFHIFDTSISGEIHVQYPPNVYRLLEFKLDGRLTDRNNWHRTLSVWIDDDSNRDDVGVTTLLPERHCRSIQDYEDIMLVDDDTTPPAFQESELATTWQVYDNKPDAIVFARKIFDSESGMGEVQFRYQWGNRTTYDWFGWHFVPASAMYAIPGGFVYNVTIPRSEWIARLNDNHGDIRGYWSAYNGDNDAPGDAEFAYLREREWLDENQVILDDDVNPPVLFNSVSSGDISKSSQEDYILKISAWDNSGISSVNFSYCFSGDRDWSTPVQGVRGTIPYEYEFHIPRSIWISHLNEEVYWKVSALDADNDRPGDGSCAYSPIYYGENGYTIDNTNDWPMFRHDIIHSGFSRSLAPSLNQTAWTFSVPSGLESSPAIANGMVYFGSTEGKLYCVDAETALCKWTYNAAGSIASSPCVVNGSVYFGSWEGNVFCLNATTGAYKWNANMSGVPSSPNVANGKVYVGSLDNNLYCLNATSGQVLWSYPTGGDIESSPAVSAGKVYFGSEDHQVYCLDAVSGAKIWNYTTGNGISSSPAVIDGRIYVGSWDGKLYCLDELGNCLWSYSTGAGVPSSPSVSHGRVYFGSYDYKFYCLDTVSGKQIWNFTTGGSIFSCPAVVDGKVYFGSYDNKAYCLDAFSGKQIWSYATNNRIYASPSIFNEKVYIPSLDGKLYCIGAQDWNNFQQNPSHNGASSSTGTITNNLLWTYATGAAINSSTAIAYNKAYVGSMDKNIYCLDVASGLKVWNYTTGGNISSSPAVVNGKVYVGSNDYKVYCLNATNGNHLWNYTTGSYVTSSPIIVDGKVIVGSQDHKLYCFNAEKGTLIWVRDLGVWNSVTTSPAVADGKVYVGSIVGRVECLDVNTGSLLYSFSASGEVSSISVVGNNVYFGSKDGKVYCLASDSSFTSVWNYTISGGFVSSPAAINNQVFIGSLNPSIRCLNAATGALNWNFSVGDKVYSSPAIAENKVYVGSNDKNVYCLNASSGAQIWSYTTGGIVQASPAVYNGKLLVGSSDGKIYCFGSEAEKTPPNGSITINGGDAFARSLTLSLTLNYSAPNSTVSQVRFSEDGVWDTELWETPTTSKQWISTSNVTTTIYYQIKSAAGALSPKYNDSIAFDFDAPSGSVVINGGANYTSSTSVSLLLTANDSTSGVAQIRFSNDGIWDTETWEAAVTSKSWMLTVGEGAKTVYYQVKDNSGWTSNTYSDTIILDTTVPTGSILINNGDTLTCSPFVTLSLNYTDTGSGVSQVRYSNINGSWTAWENPLITKLWNLTGTDGITNVFYQIEDNSGKLSSVYSDDISLDSTPPTGLILINGNASFTDSTSATLSLTYLDSTSGVAAVRYSNDGIWDSEKWEVPSTLKPYTLTSGDGLKTVYYQIRNNANWTSQTYYDSIGLDTTSPLGSIAINDYSKYTNSTSVTLKLTAYDDNSGVNSVRYSNDGVWDTEVWEPFVAYKNWTLTNGDGLKTVYYQIKDNTGCTSITYSDTITLTSTFRLSGLTSWYWTSSTTVNSVACADINGDDQVETISGGNFFDGTRNIAQLIVWNSSNRIAEKIQCWYWIGNTTINSVAAGDVNGDGQVEVVTAGSFFDGSRNVAQLIVWNGSSLAVEKIQCWYWTGNTVINSVALGDIDRDGQTEIVTGGFFNDGSRNVAQLIVWGGSSLTVKHIQCWYWYNNTVINSVKVGDVDGDGQVEVVTGGYFNDGTRNVAQLIVWSGSSLALREIQCWYWTSNTVINSLVIGDFDDDGQIEIATGGFFNDNTRNIAQLIVWSGSTLAVKNIQCWYWTNNTVINSISSGDVDADGKTEIVTAGKSNDNTRDIAQLIIWSGSNLTAKNMQSWFWTSNTAINSVAVNDVNRDFSSEIVTGGSFNDGIRSNSQLTVWGVT